MTFYDGSSPRTWGTGSLFRGAFLASRFIPTHVGNSLACLACLACLPVHPHARGEQFHGSGDGCRSSGSSPRTWGTDLHFDWDDYYTRFIPTHVGNSCPAGLMAVQLAVHPHARGEQVSDIAVDGLTGGSSPRTWGTVRCGSTQVPVHRFIPTHVGNRPCSGLPCPALAVHPHARGEQKYA